MSWNLLVLILNLACVGMLLASKKDTEEYVWLFLNSCFAALNLWVVLGGLK